MLVLSRKPGERIVFPDLGVEVEVVSIQGRAVKLGIVAPKDVIVHREEVLSKIRQRMGSSLIPRD